MTKEEHEAMETLAAVAGMLECDYEVTSYASGPTRPVRTFHIRLTRDDATVSSHGISIAEALVSLRVDLARGRALETDAAEAFARRAAS